MTRVMHLIAMTALIALATAIGSGCSTTPRYMRVTPKSSEKVSVRGHSRDLRDGRRAAIVAFNSVVFSGKRPRLRHVSDFENAEDDVDRITEEQLRELTDAMLQSFVREWRRGLPDLELLPLATVSENRLYQRLNYPRGDAIRGFSLVWGNGRKVAPAGLKYIPVPNSVGEEQKGVFFFTGAFANFTKRFEDDMNSLAEALNVDFVIFVNNRVRISGKFNQGWGGELELMEVAIVGRESARKFIFAKNITGHFSDEQAAPEKDGLTPEILTLIQTPGSNLAAGTDFAGNRFWRTMAVPYEHLAASFAERIATARD